MRSPLTLNLVANEQGSFTTPSFVSFTEEERLVGEAAKNQAAMNPVNTVFDVKSVESEQISYGTRFNNTQASHRKKIRRPYSEERRGIVAVHRH
jgi:molecular chaperone DnaK (HSP70)